MKRTILLKTMLLLCALIAGSSSVWADTKVLTFAVSTNPGGWPTANTTTLTDYTYTLDDVDYTFALKNVKCNSGYLMLTQPAVLGLPAIDGYKLIPNWNGVSGTLKIILDPGSPDQLQQAYDEINSNLKKSQDQHFQ